MIKAKYVGGGGFLTGIPRRDLTENDWAKLDDTQQLLVKNSPLYKMAPAKRKPSKKDGKTS